MPIFLDENMVGDDANQIIYPRLVLCMGVTVLMSNGHLVGAHVTDHTTEAAVLAKLALEIAALGPATAVHLYCTGNVHDHSQHGGLDIQQKAAALGFHGRAFLLDTPPYTNGTFVRVTSNGANHKCSIEYKRDDKVAYDDGGPKVATYSYFKQDWTTRDSKNGLSNPVHKPHLAKFSGFSQQIKEYTIP
jgi:hypothetical protein